MEYNTLQFLCESKSKYGVYEPQKTKSKGKDIWIVADTGSDHNADPKEVVKRGGVYADTLADAYVRAEAHLNYDKQRALDAKELVDKEATASKVRASEEDTQGFADQYSSLRRGKIIKHLNKQMHTKTGAKTIKEILETHVKDGWYVDGDGDLAHADTKKGIFTTKTFGKIGMDYVKFLTKNK